MNLTLQRLTLSTTEGNLGRLLTEDGSPVCFTLELPWLNDAPDRSCIPAGVYAARWGPTGKHPDGVYTLYGDADRSYIEIHIANYTSELLGCIAVGESMGGTGGEPAVWNSAEAYATFLAVHPARESFTLTIQNPE